MEEKSLDKNQIIGFIAIGILLVVFSWYSSKNTELPQEPAQVETEQVEESPQSIADSRKEETAAVTQDSNTTVLPSDSVNAYLAEQTYTLENEVLKLTFAGKGAQIVSAQLKDYQTHDSLPLYLINDNVVLDFALGKDLSTSSLVYEGSITKTDSSQTLLLTSNQDGKKLTMWFTMSEGDYQIKAGVTGTSLAIAEGSDVVMSFAQDAIVTEKSRKNELEKTTIYYWADDDYESLSERSDEEESEVNVEWLAHKQQFFTTIISSSTPFAKADFGTLTLTDETYSKRMASRAVMGQKVGSNLNLDYDIYLGPNKYEILKKYDKGYDKVIDFGWGIFGWISRFVVIPTFNWLEAYGLNYGLIIFIMAVLIKVVLFPLTYQSYKSMAKMRVLKPEIDALNEKNKNAEPMKKQQETMALYKQAGVNPLGGCIPQLVQMPILLAMFRFFPASIELRQQPFLWATDLSTFDDFLHFSTTIPLLGNHISIFTLLMTLSMFVYTSMNNSMTGGNAQMPQMKYIMYGMPVMMFFFFNSYASGLSYYYLVANVITFTQQWMIRKTMDEDAIHAKLQANKANPKKKKKSRFQQQLEDMQKQQGRKGQRQIKK